MGYYITVKAAEARSAVARGKARIEFIPGGPVTQWDDDGNWAGEETTPDRKILILPGLAMEGNSTGFWCHCSYGGTLGSKAMRVLGRLGINYTRDI